MPRLREELGEFMVDGSRVAKWEDDGGGVETGGGDDCTSVSAPRAKMIQMLASWHSH